jgi:hypothetical protein
MPISRKFALAAAVGALALPAVAAGTVKEVGVAQPLPAPSCPTRCEVVGQVTGFQVQEGTTKNPYQVGRAGKLVALTIKLGQPTRKQITFFSRLFGGPPQARLSVLRPARTKRRHRLTGQSEVFNLAPYYGSTPTFALARPLTVQPGYVVALTVPTWAPAFAVGFGKDQAWRSSRAPKRCDDVSQGAAQQTLGSVRRYGCFYRTARLLYSATFVPDPKPTLKPRRPRTRR